MLFEARDVAQRNESPLHGFLPGGLRFIFGHAYCQIRNRAYIQLIDHCL